jgi:hypothetical protein
MLRFAVELRGYFVRFLVSGDDRSRELPLFLSSIKVYLKNTSRLARNVLASLMPTYARWNGQVVP